MLILTRRPGESIIIEVDRMAGQEEVEGRINTEEANELETTVGAEKIIITILRTKGGQVSVGIKASKDTVTIYRDEIYKKETNKKISTEESSYDSGYDSGYSDNDSYY